MKFMLCFWTPVAFIWMFRTVISSANSTAIARDLSEQITPYRTLYAIFPLGFVFIFVMMCILYRHRCQCDRSFTLTFYRSVEESDISDIGDSYVPTLSPLLERSEQSETSTSLSRRSSRRRRHGDSGETEFSAVVDNPPSETILSSSSAISTTDSASDKISLSSKGSDGMSAFDQERLMCMTTETKPSQVKRDDVMYVSVKGHVSAESVIPTPTEAKSRSSAVILDCDDGVNCRTKLKSPSSLPSDLSTLADMKTNGNWTFCKKRTSSYGGNISDM